MWRFYLPTNVEVVKLATWTDQELLTDWMKTTWESGDPAINALAAEVERRGLDF